MVALIAALVYFHLECEKEKKEKENANVKVEFKPEETDVSDVTLSYAKFGEDAELYIGIEYFLLQWCSCAFVKLIMFFSNRANVVTDKELGDDIPKHNVTIYDARKQATGGFHEAGFTLVELEEEISKKANSLYIDEVRCCSARKSISINCY